MSSAEAVERWYVDDVVPLDELRRLSLRQWGLPTLMVVGKRWRTRMDRAGRAVIGRPGAPGDWWLVTEAIEHPDPGRVGLWYVRACDRNGIPWRGDLS